MGKVMSKVQTVNNEGATVEVQNIIQGDNNTVNIEYTVTKEPELEDFNFPEPIDSFKGRTNELKQLDEWLFQDKRSLVIVHGLPGFGKSELCKQLARTSKIAGKVKYICWIEASKIERLEHSLKNLAEILQLPKVDGRALMQKVSRRHQDSGTLFVFDDVEGPRSLLDWRTPPGCWALATSQCSEWGEELPGLAVGPLERQPAVELLQHLGRPAEHEPRALHSLAALLDHAPLALHLAAAYIRQETRLNPRTFSIRKYIQRLRKSREHFVDQPVLPHTFLPYQYCIQAAMNLSLEKIRELNNFHSGLALDILNILAYLNKHQIKQDSLLQFSFIQDKLKKEGEEEDDSEQEEEVRRALFVLESYSFVRLDDGFIRIHGLVQQTLLFYHNNTHSNIDAYYTSCLEYVLSDRTDTHSLNILQQADKKYEIYKHFYDKHKPYIISDNEVITHNNKLKVHILESMTIQNEKKNLYSQICSLHQKMVQYFNSDDILDEDNNIFKIVYNFVDKNYKIHSRTTFLEKLVNTGCQKCLTYTFSDVSSAEAKQMINKCSLMVEAMYSKQPNMIKLLVKYGADINFNQVAPGHCTILHKAVSCLNVEFIEMILELGADINGRDVLGDTCICYAILNSMMMRLDTVTTMCQVIDLLVSRGARVYDVTAAGCSLLHVAVRWICTPLHLPLLEHLLHKLHIDVNALSSEPEGGAVLHIILYRRFNQAIDDDLTTKVVELLLKHRADVQLKNQHDITPLELIELYKFDFLLPILKSKDIHIDK